MKHIKINFFTVIFLYTILFLIIYHKYIFNDFVFWDLNDRTFQFYPDLKLLSDALKNNYIPIWSNKFSSGFPVAAYGFNAYFHPFSLITVYLIKDPFISSIILFFIIGLFGICNFYFVLNLMNLDSIYKLLGVFVYYGTFHFCPTVHFYNLQMAYMFSPILFYLFYKIAFENYHKKDIFLLGIIGGFSLLSLYPAYQIRFFGLLFFVLIIFIILKKDFFRIYALLFAISIMFVISYPQLKLTYELLKVSTILKNDINYFLYKSINLSSLFNLFGNIYYKTFNAKYEGWIYYYVPGIFSYLAIFAIFYKNKKIVYILLLISFLSVFLALGKYNPLYVFLTKHNLLLGQRIPSRFLLLLNFTIPLLSVFALNSLFECQNKKNIIYYLFMIIFLFVSYLLCLYKNFNQNLLLVLKNFDKSIIMLIFIIIFKLFYKNVRLVKNFSIILLLFYVFFTTSVFFQKNNNPKYFKMINGKRDNLFIDKTLFKDFHNVYSLQPSYKSFYNISSELNIFYDVSSANIYAKALKIKKYNEYLQQAKQDFFKSGNIKKLQHLGIDGILTTKKLNIPLPYKKLDKKILIYKLPYYGNIWMADNNTFKPVKENIYFENNNSFGYNFTLHKNSNIVIFRNIFYFFDVYLNGKKISYKKYYSFYKINNVKKGYNRLDFKFSFLKLLL